MLSAPNPEVAAQQWLALTFYSHPRIDGMFLAAPDGQLIASLPAVPESISQDYSSVFWREGAAGSPDVYVSQVHPRLPDNRMTTDIVGAVRTPEGAIVGYLGVSVLVERIGRRLSSIDFADQSTCQVLDQTGMTLFTKNFVPNAGTHFAATRQSHSRDSPKQEQATSNEMEVSIRLRPSIQPVG